MDRHGDSGPYQHMERRQNAAGPEREPNGTPFLHHIQQDGRPWLFPHAGAMPDQAETTQIQLQAVLPKQVCLIRLEGMKGKCVMFCVIFECYLLFC